MGARGVAMIGIAALAVAVALLGAGAARAVPPGTTGTYPTWSVGGTSNAYSGTADFTSPTLPDPAFSSDSTSLQTASGASAYLGPGTAFGQEFGTTRAQPYVTLRPRSGSPAPTPPSVSNPPPSTTTIDFGATAPAAGWGFALGDIDADWVFLQSYDAAGAPLPVSTLGEQSVGNYCDSTPKPSACAGVVAPFDQPNWTGSSSQTVPYGTGSIVWAPGTVYGNVNDTAGAYIWFTPDPAVRRVTLSYGALSGSPVFQLWLAQPAPSTTLTGTVSLGDRPGDPVPAGTEVQLDNADGSPVAGLDGDPVRAPVDPTGAYSIVSEQRDAYVLSVIPPPGYTAPPPQTVSPATVSAITVAPFVIDPVPVATPAAPAPELAATGQDVRIPFASALVLLALGGLLLARARRNDSRE